MAIPDGEVITCADFTQALVNQPPFYDEEIIKDVRPSDATLEGYYTTGTFDAYTTTSHTFDRVNAVYPNLTKAWTPVDSENCQGSPCDPDANQIGMGNQRFTYSLEKQSWESPIMCFDLQMTKTQAKASIAYYIAGILRPATKWINNFWLMRKAMELSGKKVVVTTPVNGTLPEFNFAWDTNANGEEEFEFLNITDAATGNPIDPTGFLTQNILQREVFPLYQVGATEAGKEGFDKLELHTDIETLRYLTREEPILQANWRFTEFDGANPQFFKYGFTGMVGDYMARVWLTPLRFNKVSTGRYQTVLPYVNVPATNGLRDIPNPAYQAAWYQFSQINNRRALRYLSFNAQAINPQMPNMVRNYAGMWYFAIDNLGADCNGRAIANYRRNKGKWWADFQQAIKPEHPEWLVSFFHLRTSPCVNIIEPCGEDPGYPPQVYNSANELCPNGAEWTAIPDGSGHFVIGSEGLTCGGEVVTNSGIDETTIADLVDALNAVWVADSRTGTWAVTACESGDRVMLGAGLGFLGSTSRPSDTSRPIPRRNTQPIFMYEDNPRNAMGHIMAKQGVEFSAPEGLDLKGDKGTASVRWMRTPGGKLCITSFNGVKLGDGMMKDEEKTEPVDAPGEEDAEMS